MSYLARKVFLFELLLIRSGPRAPCSSFLRSRCKETYSPRSKRQQSLPSDGWVHFQPPSQHPRWTQLMLTQLTLERHCDIFNVSDCVSWILNNSKFFCISLTFTAYNFLLQSEQSRFGSEGLVSYFVQNAKIFPSVVLESNRYFNLPPRKRKNPFLSTSLILN